MEIFLLGYILWTEWKDTKRHRAYMRRARQREDAMIRIIANAAASSKQSGSA